MKKIYIIILTITVLFSCEEPDNAIYDVFDNVENGAALRDISPQELTQYFNIFDTESTWEIIVEEQDEQYGDLLDKVNVYVSFIDKANDGANNKAEVLVKTIAKNEFTTSNSGLPTTHIVVSFQDALDTLSMVDGDYNGGDSFPIRLELVLTDGRTFSSESTSDSLQQSFWSSPFAYNSQILCFPPTPIDGNYHIKLHDSYGDGWQGSKITVTIDGVAQDYALPDLWTAGLGGTTGDAMYVFYETDIVVPAGTETLVWEFTAGDYPSEVSFEVYGPNSGQIIGEFGPTPAEGVFNLNYCNE